MIYQVKDDFSEMIHIQGVRILRKEAYEQYAGLTKDEHNAVDEALTKSSLLEFDCIADKAGAHSGVPRACTWV